MMCIFINFIIISSLSYGLFMYMIKNINKTKNTQNADNLLSAYSVVINK